MNAQVLALEPKNIDAAKSKIDAVFEAIINSWNRHNGTDYVALFTEQADFVNVIGMHWRGHREIEAEFTSLHKTIFRSSQIHALDRSVRFLRPDVAVVHCLWEMTGHERLPGLPWAEARQGMMTCVMVEANGQWRIDIFHNTDIVHVPLPE